MLSADLRPPSPAPPNRPGLFNFSFCTVKQNGRKYLPIKAYGNTEIRPNTGGTVQEEEPASSLNRGRPSRGLRHLPRPRATRKLCVRSRWHMVLRETGAYVYSVRTWQRWSTGRPRRGDGCIRFAEIFFVITPDPSTRTPPGRPRARTQKTRPGYRWRVRQQLPTRRNPLKIPFMGMLVTHPGWLKSRARASYR